MSLVSPIDLAPEHAPLRAELDTMLIRELLRRSFGATLALLPAIGFLFSIAGGRAAPGPVQVAFAATLAITLATLVFVGMGRAGRFAPSRRTFAALAVLAGLTGLGFAAIIVTAAPCMDPFHIAAFVATFVAIAAVGVISMAPSPTLYAIYFGGGLLALIYASFHDYFPGLHVLGRAMMLSLPVSLGVMVWLAHRSLHGQFLLSLVLEGRNGELAAALARLRSAQERIVASEKLTAVGRLMAQLSHEINNPVNVIQNNLDPIADYLDDLDQVLDIARRQPDVTAELDERWRALDIDFVRADMRDALGSMRAATERICTIQNDLRSFLRGDAECRGEADLNAGVRSTVAMMRRNLGSNTVVVERYGDLPRAHFHAGQVNQVTMNLLQNAIDVVGPAGRIEIETRAELDALVLSIADSGPGLSEVARRHLFEPFFTTKSVGKGTGLGLATCYQIVRAHGGTITLDEAHRPGARFVVKLPLPPTSTPVPG